MRVCIGKKDIPQIVEVHIYPYGSVLKGLQQELTNGIGILLLYFS